MTWHDHVCADPCSMRRAFLPETQKSFVNCRCCQNVATVLRASVHDFRFLMGLCVTAGKLLGVNVELAGTLAAGLPIGNANVAEGDGEGVPDGVDEGDGEGLG